MYTSITQPFSRKWEREGENIFELKGESFGNPELPYDTIAEISMLDDKKQ